MKKLYVWLMAAFMFGDLGLMAQEGRYDVLFSAKTIVPQSEISQQLFLNNEQPIGGKYFRMIQFQRPLSVSDRAQLDRLGIVLHEYIPHNAYLADFPSSFNVQSLSGLPVRTVMPLESDWKLAKNVYLNDIPEWADRGLGKAEMVLVPIPGLSNAAFANLLETSGVRLIVLGFRGPYADVEMSLDDVERMSRLPFIQFIHAGEEPGEPENDRARTSHRVSLLNTRYNVPAHYDGSGVIVSLGDDGDIGPHIDYQGRLTSLAGASSGDHGDHVAGTIFGAGNRNPRGMGMAPGSEMLYYSYPANLNNADADYNGFGIRITSSSYSNGCNAGYTTFARNMDLTSFNNPGLLHVFSAGNSGTTNCNYGAGNNWGNITGGHKMAKNVIAVGNVQFTDAIANSSSRGPGTDGRVKPEVVAVGTSVFSTTDPHAYTVKTGTSMACPGVSGSLTLMYQAYKGLHNGADPDGGLAKSILMNTCDDLGNPGPDFIFGYGKINVARGIEAIEKGWHITDNIATNQNKTHTVNVPANTAEVRIMLYWTDPPAAVNSARALVNNLDMTVTQGGNTWLPWVLNPTPNTATLNAPAVRAVDSLNNVEQVTIVNPTAGTYTVNVSGLVPVGNEQKYYISYFFVPNTIELVHPAGGEQLVPGEDVQIRWNAPAGTGSFTIQWSANGGNTWANVATAAAADARLSTWTVPNTATGQGRVRVTRGTVTATSDTDFTIMRQATNVEVSYACPDSLLLTWNAVPGATGYVVHRLGQKYMDSIGFSTTTNFLLTSHNPSSETWFAVSARGANNANGRRSIAILQPATLTNCNLTRDAGIAEVLHPQPGFWPGCQPIGPIELRILNGGSDPLFNIPVAYSLNGGTPVWDTVVGPIAPNSTMDFTFGQAGTWNTSGVNSMVFFVSKNDDQNKYNDTLMATLEISQTLETLPYSTNFQAMPLCVNTNSCENDVCPAGIGWVNLPNRVADDIDWIVNSGTTPSANTGPPRAFNPNNNQGHYLYLEATACFGKVGRIMSPCIDLTTASLPELTFRYHMLGTNMGNLHVDVLADGLLYTDVMPVLSGNQGNNWLLRTVDLSPFAGKVINIIFRGITGPSWQSDMAIDDINIIETSVAPAVAFTATPNVACTNTEVLLRDQSLFGQSRTWEIVPSTYNLLRGSTLTDTTVFVEFTTVGTYSVKLTVTNVNGVDSLLDANAIQITPGNALPIMEDFSSGVPPTNWRLENPDNATTWAFSSQVTGMDGNITRAAFINLFDYANALGQRDYLILPTLNLQGAQAPVLSFEVAYARFNANFFDSLAIELSTNCGASFDTVIYHKWGSNLATRADLNTAFSPTQASDWRREFVDLSGFAQSDIVIRFRSGNGYGNNLFINNVNILDTLVQLPTASLNQPTGDFCVNDSLLFTVNTTGSPTYYEWHFGAGANPQTATAAGPVSVSYSNPGAKRIIIRVFNPGGMTADTLNINIGATPLANFSFFSPGSDLTYNFTDASVSNPTSWLWDFGDGNTSTLQNPMHTFQPGAVYTITLVSSNDCGANTITRTLDLTTFNLDAVSQFGHLTVSPNPSGGVFVLGTDLREERDFLLQVTDLAGRVVHRSNMNPLKDSGRHELDLRHLSKGSYMLQVGSEGQTRTIKVVIQ
jgi:PKD repeat protein